MHHRFVLGRRLVPPVAAMGLALAGLVMAAPAAHAATLAVGAATTSVASGATTTTADTTITLSAAPGGSGVTVSAAISGAATLSGTTTVSVGASGTTAAFSNLVVNAPVGAYTIVYAATGYDSISQTVTVTVGAAAKLGISTAAAGSSSGVAFTTQPVLLIQDSGGNTVTGSSAVVTASTTGAATTVGTATATASSGVATFSSLGITASAGTYALLFTSGSLTGATQSIAVAGTAAALSIVTQPAGPISGAPFNTQPAIAIVDASGNRVTSSAATVTAAVSPGATLVGTITATAVNGLATFTNLGVAGTVGSSYTLTFSSSGLTAISTNVTPTVGPAAKLGISVTAAGATSGAPLTTQPKISTLDAGGNFATLTTATITATVSSGATLTGSTSVAVVCCTAIATFTNLGVTGPAGTYTITYSSPGLTSATQPITIAATAPTISAISPNTGLTTGGSTIVITGTNFTGATSVTFGGTPGANLVVASPTSITVKTPAHAAGLVNVDVANATTSGSLASGFNFISPGKSLGAGVYLAPAEDPPGTRVGKLTKASTKAGKAKYEAVYLNTPTKVRMSGVPKKSKMKAQVKVGGSWKSMGSFTSNSKGQITLRGLVMTRAGTYYVRVIKGGTSYYVRANS